MKRVIFAAAGTVIGLVMLLSFKTHAATVSSPSTVPATSPTSGTSSASAATSSSAGTASTNGSGATPTTAAPASGTTTVTGTAIDTRYGPVQVQITVVNGKVTVANATEYPTDTRRDEQINAYAIPRLNQETLAASSAKIDTISGATYTSEGYLTSLQSALTKAGLS